LGVAEQNQLGISRNKILQTLHRHTRSLTTAGEMYLEAERPPMRDDATVTITITIRGACLAVGQRYPCWAFLSND
jgi:hypothetical protein